MKRFEKLTKAGFLDTEARVLSKVPTNVPYMKGLIAERQALFNKAKKRDMTKGEYERRIKLKYHAKGWTEYGRMGDKHLRKFNQSAVWKMLRAYEDRYKDDHPSYKSPWIPRQKAFSEFTRKYKFTMFVD